MTTHSKHEHLNALLVELMRQGDQLAVTVPVHARVSLTETLMLHHLDHDGPSSQQDLAHQVGVDKSTASRVVASLADRGAVERVRDPSNRRMVVVTITEEGRRRHRDAAAAISQRTDAVFDAMSPQDQAALQRGLTALLAALRHTA
ncbi:MAG: MarR family winged helix-turn-helix transcriptional regulator [Arachnia sp.]